MTIPPAVHRYLRVAPIALAFLGAIVILGFTLRAFLVPSRGTTREPLVVASKASAMTSIAIARQGSDFSIILSRGESSWTLGLGTSRYPLRAGAIEGFIDALTRKRVLTRVGTGDGEPWGLEIPDSYTVSILGEQGEELEIIRFGGTDVAGKARYLSRGMEGKILKTDDDLGRYLDIAAASWVNLSPFATLLRETDIQEAIWHSGNEKIELRAGRSAESDALLASLEAELTAFTCRDVTNIPGNPSAERLTVRLGDLRELTLAFTPLGSVWIMTVSPGGEGYIVAESKARIDRALLP